MNRYVFFNKKIWVWLCCFITSFAINQASFAQDTPPDVEPDNHERMYQVEMIVFARNHAKSQQELWPKNLKLSYPQLLTRLKPADASASDVFTLLPTNDRQLNAQASTLANSGSYTLLFHEAWRQMIYTNPSSIFISGGKTYNGHQELEGSIDLSVAQYLKIHTNLWLTEFSNSPSNSLEPTSINAVFNSWPELPTPPGSEYVPETTNEYAVKQIVKMNQQRSMRSVEVHYIDHPLFGIVIKIIPYDPPSL